ncbi:MAG: hypothetical protein ACFFEN_09485 [Candidatus Thorarchaeota archaeon]
MASLFVINLSRYAWALFPNVGGPKKGDVPVDTSGIFTPLILQ